MKNIVVISVLLLAFSCSPATNGIRKGTFELYENDSLIGHIYRLGNFQIEKYPNGKELIARIDHQSDSTYFLRGIEEIQSGVDSLVWLNHYQEIEKNKFVIIATPLDSDSDYTYEAVLLKIDEEISETFSDRLKNLNN